MIFDEYTYVFTYVYGQIVINPLLSGMGMGEEWARSRCPQISSRAQLKKGEPELPKTH
jgi:hypothetical protein|tara:strand:- start:705 stop:878 length:174 start_codon:yes stop_codon:yes gene_type:complete